MKPRPVLVILAALLAVAASAHFFRYTIVDGSNPRASIVYRLDRFTGRVEWSSSCTAWQTIPEK